MKKSTLSTAILVGMVIGLASCRGEDSNIVFADRKSDDKFTQPPPHRIHQPNKHIVEDVNRKPGSSYNNKTEEAKKKETSDSKKDFLYSDVFSSVLNNPTITTIPQDKKDSQEKTKPNFLPLTIQEILKKGEKTDSAASRAYEKNLRHQIYAKTYAYKDDNDRQIKIQDPNGAFSYQTFGEVVDPNSASDQFINIGQPTTPSDDASFEARYSGASLGAIDGEEYVYADVSADVNFTKNKTMNLQFTNSKRGEKLTKAKDLDFSETLNWQNGKFTGASSQAHFYGPNGEEIGGHFSRTTNGKNYEGVFGLKKQQ